MRNIFVTNVSVKTNVDEFKSIKDWGKITNKNDCVLSPSILEIEESDLRKLLLKAYKKLWIEKRLSYKQPDIRNYYPKTLQYTFAQFNREIYFQVKKRRVYSKDVGVFSSKIKETNWLELIFVEDWCYWFFQNKMKSPSTEIKWNDYVRLKICLKSPFISDSKKKKLKTKYLQLKLELKKFLGENPLLYSDDWLHSPDESMVELFKTTALSFYEDKNYCWQKLLRLFLKQNRIDFIEFKYRFLNK